MLSNLRLNSHAVPLNEEESMLPSMTVAFINCLGSEDSRQPQARLKPQTPDDQAQSISIVALDAEPSSPSGSDNRNPLCLSPHHELAFADQAGTVSSPAEHMAVRTLIKSISHHFNNLLMGMWGNITLLRMRYDQHHPVGVHLLKMDNLVESGAFLIHMVLGYLCERRIATRRLRLDQIVQELFEAGYQDPVSMDRYDLKKRLKWAASVQQPSMIAGSTAKVLDILLNSLSAHRQSISEYAPEDIGLAEKIDHIENLILRGYKFVQHLSQYADSFESGEATQFQSELKRS